MKNNDIDESTVTKRDSGLNIDQMRAIVDGAKPWALFYVHNGEYAGCYGNYEGVCVEGCFTDRAGLLGESVSIKDLRAAIASHIDPADDDREIDEQLNQERDAIAEHDVATVAEVPGSNRTAKQIVDQTHELAELFYRRLGYNHDRAKHGNLYDSKHPTELACWEMACIAQEELTGTDPENALSDLEEDNGHD